MISVRFPLGDEITPEHSKRYRPRVKMAMGLNALERNTRLYGEKPSGDLVGLLEKASAGAGTSDRPNRPAPGNRRSFAPPGELHTRHHNPAADSAARGRVNHAFRKSESNACHARSSPRYGRVCMRPSPVLTPPRTESLLAGNNKSVASVRSRRVSSGRAVSDCGARRDSM
jgi:hypothetical protein